MTIHTPQELLQRRAELIKGPFGFYSKNCLVINTKTGPQSFVLNREQRKVDEILERQIKEKGFVRAIILKGRQQGISTYVQGRFIRKTSQQKGKRAFILTHEKDATDNLFNMANRFYNNLPTYMRPELGKSNAKELSFDKLDSGYRVGTAGNKAVGRSQTVQYFHASEVAFWPNADEHTKGILQTVPDAPGTEIIMESTANGVGNYFHVQWKLAEKGLSDFIAIFVPWFWHEEYQRTPPEGFAPTEEEYELQQQYGLSNAQLYWRRLKIVALHTQNQDGETSFKQEYPNNAAEAFQFSGGATLITSEMCMRARKREVKGTGTLVVGVDPSEGGDRFAIVFRHGAKMYGEKAYTGADVASFFQRVQICHKILTTVCPVAGKVPDMMFIDYACGRDIADELVRMGHKGKVRAVNFSITPMMPEKYSNKRNEIIGEFAEWMKDETMPPQIPDSDEFQADLCATPYTWDSKERRCLRPKEFIRSEYGFSPDYLDAGALTFSYPRMDYQSPGEARRPKPVPVHGKVRNARSGRHQTFPR